MANVRWRAHGKTWETEAAVGESLRDASKKIDAPEGDACGGVCACSTCHVKVKQGGECLAEASEDELDQLDTARDVGLDSRLSCQARLLRVPPGGTVEIVIPTWNVNAVREGGGH